MNTFDLRTNMRTSKKDASKKEIIFMGTGPFALTILTALIQESETHIVTSVITKQDAKVGRSGSDISSQVNAIKEVAFAHGISLLQPAKFDKETLDSIASLAPDLFIVASYGRILPEELLAIAPLGAVNVHASLLPLLRGSSPIQNAIIEDFSQTGVTVMQMDSGMDTGDIISQKSIEISPEMFTADLERELAQMGSNTLLEALPQILDGTVETTPQDHSLATLCQLIEREDGHVMWIRETTSIYNLYRALTPWPGLFAYWKKSPTERIRVKLTKIRPYEGTLNLTQYTAGTVFNAENFLCIRTLDGAIIVETLQRADKKEMPASDFIAGNQKFIGTILQ